MSRQQLSDEAAAYVRELIVSGQLRAPEFVRVERIADDLGISVTPVREGLLALRGEGFLQLEPRKGFVVAPLSSDDVRDLFWVQAELAGELAARATQRLTDDQVADLVGLQDTLTDALARQDLDEVERRNHEFHRTINLAAGAPKLMWFLRTAARYVPNRFYHRIGGWPDASMHDHVAILDALKRREPDIARIAMQEHIVHAGRLLAEHLDQPVPEESDDTLSATAR